MFTFLLFVLIIAMLVSLAISLKSLFSGAKEKQTQPSTYRWLAIRVSLAIAIIITVVAGISTGEFTLGAPWTGQY